MTQVIRYPKAVVIEKGPDGSPKTVTIEGGAGQTIRVQAGQTTRREQRIRIRIQKGTFESCRD
jgi:hypothetical protein